MKYELNYDGDWIATVEIEEEIAAPFIKEMVEFWSGGEQRLIENAGDYTKAFLKQFGYFILCHNSLPKNREGWYSLDGEYGIKVINWIPYDFDEDLIEIV